MSESKCMKNNRFNLLLLIGFLQFFSVARAGDFAGPYTGNFIYLNKKLSAAASDSLVGDLVNQFPPGPSRVFLRNLTKAIGKNPSGRAFNPAITKYQDGYLIAVRLAFLNDPSPFNDNTIKPGNRLESKFEKGKNFWWQDFNSEKFSGGALYFYADKDWQKMSLLIPYTIHSPWLNALDNRLGQNKSGDHLVFNAKERNIAAKLFIDIKNSGPGQIYFSGDLLNRARANNYGLIDADFQQEKYSYLDWYYKEGVRLTSYEGPELKHSYLRYDDRFPILGTGSSLEDGQNAGDNSGLMPLFSFGSNHLKLEADKETYFGVGHIKIPVDDELSHYAEGSNLANFREWLVRDFKQEFGERYIRHDAYNSRLNESKGYHYLAYFYSFSLNSDGTIADMKISDAYLPINTKEAKKQGAYVFSLAFPMGITESVTNNENLVISLGIGDYYAGLIELPKTIMNLCRHDVSQLDMRNYEYKLMIFDGEGNFELRDRLLEH